MLNIEKLENEETCREIKIRIKEKELLFDILWILFQNCSSMWYSISFHPCTLTYTAFSSL